MSQLFGNFGQQPRRPGERRYSADEQRRMLETLHRLTHEGEPSTLMRPPGRLLARIIGIGSGSGSGSGSSGSSGSSDSSTGSSGTSGKTKYRWIAQYELADGTTMDDPSDPPFEGDEIYLPAIELNDSPDVPTDGSAIVELWPSDGGAYYWFDLSAGAASAGGAGGKSATGGHIRVTALPDSGGGLPLVYTGHTVYPYFAAGVKHYANTGKVWIDRPNPWDTLTVGTVYQGQQYGMLTRTAESAYLFTVAGVGPDGCADTSAINGSFKLPFLLDGSSGTISNWEYRAGLTACGTAFWRLVTDSSVNTQSLYFLLKDGAGAITYSASWISPVDWDRKSPAVFTASGESVPGTFTNLPDQITVSSQGDPSTGHGSTSLGKRPFWLTQQPADCCGSGSGSGSGSGDGGDGDTGGDAGVVIVPCCDDAPISKRLALTLTPSGRTYYLDFVPEDGAMWRVTITDPAELAFWGADQAAGHYLQIWVSCFHFVNPITGLVSNTWRFSWTYYQASHGGSFSSGWVFGGYDVTGAPADVPNPYFICPPGFEMGRLGFGVERSDGTLVQPPQTGTVTEA